MRLDRCPVLPFLDDDGCLRPAYVLAADRHGRVCLMWSRGADGTRVGWRPAARLTVPDGTAVAP